MVGYFFGVLGTSATDPVFVVGCRCASRACISAFVGDVVRSHVFNSFLPLLLLLSLLLARLPSLLRPPLQSLPAC